MKLTRKSPHGDGYSIESGKICETIYKLGAIEDAAEDLTGKICDDYCRHSDKLREEMYADQLEAICEHCPVRKLVDLIV